VTDIRKLGAEHSIDVDLLPESPVVFDVGCRGFEFDHELLKLRPKARIFAVDADPAIKQPDEPRIHFVHCAITERPTPHVLWQGDGDGAYICSKPGEPGYGWGVHDVTKSAEVPNTTITDFMEAFEINHFDVIKLDIEGSEFGILESWPGPIAEQISIEFHDFIDRNRWNDAYFEKLFAGPLKDYNVALFGLTPLGPGNSLGHWDTLLVRK
jgi:FkbM family methyltransferase